MRNKDINTFEKRRLEQMAEFFSLIGEKPLSVRTSAGGRIAISCVSDDVGEKTLTVRTSHSGASAISGPACKRRGAPPGNQRALKTGYHTAKRRALRSRIARMLDEINLTLALHGKTDPVKRRRLPRVKLKCCPPDTTGLATEEARVIKRAAQFAADPAIFSPCALDSPAAAERPAEGIVDG